jgi:mannose-1-phosphate guanylyltransferase
MRVMLLAAGRSTRLGAIGQLLPKPLLPICGYPAIRFGIAASTAAGFRDIVINLFHHAGRIRDTLGDGAAFGAKLRYSEEDVLLGTAGGLARAAPLLGAGPVLVMNAKVVCDVDLGAVAEAHARAEAGGSPGGAAAATLVVRDDPRAEEWGPIGVDADDRIVRILGSTAPHRSAAAPPTAVRMFTGIQVVGATLRARMRPAFSDSVRDIYIPALEEGLRLAAARLEGYFAEHSTIERYWAGNLALLRDPGCLRHPPGPLVGVDPEARVHPGATIIGPVRVAPGAVLEAGAHVGPEVVVGPGAVVTAGARVARTVVWAGARVAGAVENAIVTEDGLYPVI